MYNQTLILVHKSMHDILPLSQKRFNAKFGQSQTNLSLFEFMENIVCICVHVKACSRSIEWKRKVVVVHITLEHMHGTANLLITCWTTKRVYMCTTNNSIAIECTRCALVADCKERCRPTATMVAAPAAAVQCMHVHVHLHADADTETTELTSQPLVTLGPPVRYGARSLVARRFLGLGYVRRLPDHYGVFRERSIIEPSD